MSDQPFRHAKAMDAQGLLVFIQNITYKYIRSKYVAGSLFVRKQARKQWNGAKLSHLGFV